MNVAGVRNSLVLAAAIGLLATAPLKGQYVYVANGYGQSITGLQINSGGTLTPIGTFSTPSGAKPVMLVMDPTRKYLYAAYLAGNSIGAFRVGNGGLLEAMGPPVAAGWGPISLAVEPAGRYLYAVNTFDDTIMTFDIQAGGLTARPQPVATGSRPYSVAVDPTGRFVYVANAGEGTISMYQSSLGVLSPLGKVATGSAPTSIAVDPDGSFAYVTNPDPGELWAYTIGTSGLLTYKRTVATGAGARFVAQAPGGGPIFVVNTGNNTVSYLGRDADGNFTNLRTGPLVTGNGPGWVAIDRYIYVANMADTTISAYRFLPQAFIGAVGTFPSGPMPYSLVISSCGAGPRIGEVSANPATLWPPDRKMTRVQVDYPVTSLCGNWTCELQVNSTDPKVTEADWNVIDAHTVELRAERTPTNADRTYIVGVQCTAAGGGRSWQGTDVIVTHEK